jgi:23S rRNA-/tRNA-specific pseudouridylate synthase
VTVPKLLEPTRVDKYLAQVFPELSRSLVANYCKQKLVRLGDGNTGLGKVLAAGDIVHGGEVLKLSFEIKPIQADGSKIKGELAIKVIFKDENLAVIEKPSGMPSVVLANDDPVTVADSLAKLGPEFLTASADKRESGLIHRLDNQSSGLMIAASSNLAWSLLRAKLKDGEIKKSYQCLIEEETNFKNFALKLFLGAKGRKVRIESKNFEDATETTSTVTTNWSGKFKGKKLSIVTVSAEFAKRHQVRAHMAFLGHPLVGDSVYESNLSLGEFFSGTERQFILHANYLSFTHPFENRVLAFNSDNDLLLGLLKEVG